MPALSVSEKAAIKRALDTLENMLDCCLECTDAEDEEIQSYIDGLRGLLDKDGIDWVEEDDSIKASTNRKGIHLNPKFGGDYTNDYQLPADYLLDDCANGYFSSFWKLLEMLFHEYYHYLHHTGFWGAIGAGLLVVGGWLSAPVEYLAWPVAGKPSPYNAKEMWTYFHTYVMLSRLLDIFQDCCDSDVDTLIEGGDVEDVCDCIGCCDELLAALREAKTRQDPWPK